MTSIYRTAFQVIAWLGSQSPGQADLEQQLRSSAELIRSQSGSCTGIGHLYDLLSRKYWRRIWIVQEISVAIDVWLVCGSSWVNWNTLCEVMDLYEGRFDNESSVSELVPTNAIPLQAVVVAREDEMWNSYHGFRTLRQCRLLMAKWNPIGFLEALE